MNEKFENELYQIDPIFFEHAIACKEGKENEMTTCMYFGCECGDGWFEPIKKLAKKTAFLNELGKKYNVKFVCDQLKEKFGEFTCYVSLHVIDESIKNEYKECEYLYSMLRNAIDECEKECWNVCEWCGAEGGINGENLITTHGWIYRICKKCAKEKAEGETKHYDENNKLKHVPRITWFHEGYEFLNMYDVDSFQHNEKYYNSIIEAFYCNKDQKHAKEIYNEIGRHCDDKKSPYFIERIANEFGFKYDDNEDDYMLLKEITKAKFTYEYNKDIKEELLETDGKLLQNMGRHHNNILGHCICDECKDKEHKDLYSKILMDIRDELKNER